MRRVAVTGIGVISAVGTGKDEFFAGLAGARSGIRRVELAELPRLKTRIAAQVQDFDAGGHFAKDRLSQLDRFSQFALVAGREAWAQSRDPGHDADRRGLFWGTGMGGATTVEAGYAALLRDGRDRVKPLTVVAGMANAAAANLAIEFGVRGPSYTYAVACASSAIAIGEAFRAVGSGWVDCALAGGSEALITFGLMKSWEALMTLALEDAGAPESSCRPFALDRTGFVLGEGAGALVLEDLELARQRGAPILAELVGYGTSSDASHLSRPDSQGQVRAMRSALDQALRAGVAPADIGYLNAHGTATMIGDKVETTSIKQVFGPHAQRLPISSTKALHGHVMGAGGAIELIAALLALQHGTVPPTAHLRNPDPDCDLDYVPLTPRAAPDLHAIMSNSFAFGGANAALIARKAA